MHPSRMHGRCAAAEGRPMGEVVIVQRPAAELAARVDGLPLALAHVARMRSDAGRDAVLWRLDVAARILSRDRADALAYPWHALTPDHVSMLAKALANGTGGAGRAYGPRTCNAIMAAVRGVTREAWRQRMLDADDLARLWDDVRPEPMPTVNAGRYVEPGERMALWQAAAADALVARGARDAAMLALLDGAGLRAAEAATVAWAAVDLDAERVTIRGKGRKLRAVDLATGSADALVAWRAMFGADDPPDAPPGAVLRTVDRHGNAGDRLPVRGIARALDRLTRATGGACRPLTPHDLRRTYISDRLDAGADLAAVAALVGHANVTTTAKYDRRGDRARRAVARLLAVPYQPRPAE